MSKATCFLCSQRFNVQSSWCNACESFPEDEFCPYFMPRIPMDEAPIQYFRTGKLPQNWSGIDMPEYYRILDIQSGRIEFDTSDKFYLFLKEILCKYGINLNEVKTLTELTEIEHDYYYEINSAIIQRHQNSKPKDIDEAYTLTPSNYNKYEADRLLNLIYERDRKGFKVI
jgi:hypothetical protein